MKDLITEIVQALEHLLINRKRFLLMKLEAATPQCWK
jgi:hypothetical protein